MLILIMCLFFKLKINFIFIVFIKRINIFNKLEINIKDRYIITNKKSIYILL